MVDFAKADDVKRWLDAIEPAERRREVAIALAARAALRVTPLLGRELRLGKRTHDEILLTFILPPLRATALSWVAAKYPARGHSLGTAAFAVAFDAFAHTEADDPAAHDAARATTAAFVTLEAADAAIAAADAAFAAVDAASFAATPNVDAAIFAAAFADASDASNDAALIDSGRSAAELAGTPLWPNGAPDWASDAWRTFKSDLLAADQNWDVWIDWYEARLAGDAANPPNEALEVARATIPDEVWKRGPVAVNAEIKRLIDEHQNLQQRPAAFQFRVVDDKIDALPEDARPLDPETARDFYDETKRKGQDLRTRLQRAQADENIRAHVDLLLTRLGSSYADMRPGLMLSMLRSLESDVRAYDGEEGRKELSAAHLSSIIDLAQSVRDLCAVFPRSREIEAEAVSLDLPMQRMPEIRDAIGSVVAKINASDGATEGGRAAINASAADLAHQRSLAEEAKQSAYFLVDFANFARAGVKHLKATGRTVGGEIAGLGVDSWRAVRRGAPKGIERGAAQAGKALVVGGVAALMHWLGSDIAALGTMVAPYLPLHEMLEKMTGASSASADDAVSAPARGASKSPKPKTRKRGNK
jgi:hypothetical protein